MSLMMSSELLGEGEGGGVVDACDGQPTTLDEGRSVHFLLELYYTATAQGRQPICSAATQHI